MLGRKASFVFGAKSILCLFLAFALYGKASAATHAEFGCLFVNREYKMHSNYNKERPVYGNIAALAPLSTQNTVIIESLKRKVFTEANIMNDVYPLTEFVKAYKLQWKSISGNNNTLESFFNSYEIPFKIKEYYVARNYDGTRRTHDPVSYLIQEFNALKTYLALTQKFVSPYLVTAYVDPIGIDFSTMGYNAPQVSNLLMKRVQDHVAGIIKITVGGRRGYILMDPGYANGGKLYDPFIVYVMEDKLPPHGGFISNSINNGDLVFTTGGGTGSSFILVRHNKPQVKYGLYFVDMSYCSFMENTVKANLIRFNHGIVSRSVNGTHQAYVTFKLSSQDKPSLPESMKNDIPKYRIAAITKEFDYIQRSVLGKPHVLLELNNLAKKLDLDVEQRQQYPEPEPQSSRSRQMETHEPQSSRSRQEPQSSRSRQMETLMRGKRKL